MKVRDGGHVVSKAAHIAAGVDLEGVKHVLGISGCDNEASAFWAHVYCELANQGCTMCWLRAAPLPEWTRFADVHVAHGLSSSIPVCSKSLVLRVAQVAP